MGVTSYFQIRAAIARAEALTPIAKLDGVQKRIIYLIADEMAQGQGVRMSQLKAHREFGTMPTILSRLNGMIESGLLARVPDPTDGRSHHLALTPKAKRAIERVSREVERFALTQPGTPGGKRRSEQPSRRARGRLHS